jgi:RNA polymerase sigma factor (sigma-70 family)
MGEPPNTRASLLLRIRDAHDGQAWTQFVELYAPLVYGFARKRGLQDADAADLTQEVLRAVARAVGRLEYDPQRGSFRSWLFTVARNKLANFLTRRRPDGAGVDSQEVLAEQPAREEVDLWEQEYQQRLLAWAAEQVRGQFAEPTWKAFWQTAVEGKNPRETATALGMSVGAVYIARSRVLARLKEQVQQLEHD